MIASLVFLITRLVKFFLTCFRSLFGGRKFGPQNGQTGGIPPEGFVRADARHLHLRHQHDRGQGFEVVRVPDLSKACPHRYQLHRVHRLRERHRTQTLDHERSGSALRHQIIFSKKFRKKHILSTN